MADGLFVEGAETLAPFVFDHMPTVAELLPHGSWVVLTQAQRTQDRARQAHDEGEALAEAIGWPGPHVLHPLDEALGEHVRLHLSEFTQGLDLGLTDWGSAQGNPAELAARLADLAARSYRLIVSSRGHGSLERVREFVGAGLDVDAVEAPLANGFISAAGTVAVATEEDFFGSRKHTRTAPRFTTRRNDCDRRRARAGRLRRPSDPRRRPLRGHHAPGARRRGTRLPDPGVRAGRQAVRAERSGRHGRALPRRRRAAPAPARRLRLGQGHHQGQARGAGTWPASSSACTASACRCRATRSAPTRRGSTSWRTRSRTTRPAISSPRSKTSSTTWSCRSRWTA